MIDFLETACLWLMIAAGVMWIFTSFALINAMERDRKARSRHIRNRRIQK